MHSMQQHGSKYFPCRPSPQPWGWGQKVKILTCSEYGHVAYQIKWNPECSNMVANILLAEPLRCPLGYLFHKLDIVIFVAEGMDSMNFVFVTPATVLSCFI